MPAPYLSGGDRLYSASDASSPPWVRNLCECAGPVKRKRNAESAFRLKLLADLEAQAKEIAEQIKFNRECLQKACSHPMPARAVVVRSRENEFGTGFVPTPDEVWCIDCGQKIAETEPR